MNSRPKTFGDKFFNSINCALLILFGIVVAYPFWHLLVLSFSMPEFANQPGLKLFPSQITTEAYRHILHDDTIINAYIVTITRTFLGTLISAVLSVSAAYALSKEVLPIRKIIYWGIIFTGFFGGGIIPTFILFKSLHLTNTVWAMVLPEMLNVFYILIIRGYINSIPDSLEESALMDGANELVLFFKIVVPLSMPIIAAVSLYTAVFHWNDWFYALIFVTEPKMAVLQTVLRRLIIDNNLNMFTATNATKAGRLKFTPESVKAAATIVAIGPIIFVYPYAQKFFIKGIYSGSVKG